MNLLPRGTHEFRCFTPADPFRVWTALTDGQETGWYLYGLVAESSWCPDAPIRFRAPPHLPECQTRLVGQVLCVQPYRQLSYFLRSGPEDPATYLTWQLRPCPGGSAVRLLVDDAERAGSIEDAEDTWLPVLAALQARVSGARQSRP